MTRDELVETAKRQLNAGQPEPHVWPEAEIDIDACVLVASNEVALEAMCDPYMRALLQQVYSVTLDASGQGNLLTATGSITGAAGEILLDGIRDGVVLDADGNQLESVLHYADFIRPQPTVFPRYCIKDRDKILTCAKDVQSTTAAEIQGVNGPLTITASFQPASVANFPPALEDRLVQKLCDVVTRKVSTSA
jgi:hypothetical protein